ncbi:unnamed protein product [Sphagnum balticum]
MAGLPGADIESWVLVVEQARGDSQKRLTPAPDQFSTLSRCKRKKPSTIQPSAPTPPLSHSEQGPLADMYSMDGQSDSSQSSQRKKQKTTALSDNLSVARLSNYSLPQPASEKRENSPTRELIARYKNADPPIKFLARPDEGTPESVRQLLQTLPVLCQFGINVIPGALQADDDGALHKVVRDIMQEALECVDGAAAEAQWQKLADHLLEGAFKLKKASKMLKVRITASMRISQYTDAELARMTFPACVEIGSPEKSYSEAALQVAVWSSAGLRKLEQLRDRFVQDSTLEIPPLVMWTAIGTDWKLHISYIDSRSNCLVS